MNTKKRTKSEKKIIQTELLIAGGGTGGTAAAIQAARMGIQVSLVSETEWLGGMLSSAGVSCVDGNHQLSAGLFGEFKEKLYEYYGGPEKLKTGWVSHTNFEPYVGNQIFQKMAQAHDNLQIYKQYKFHSIEVEKDKIKKVTFTNNKGKLIRFCPSLVIEGTEFGDLAAAAGCQYLLGLDGEKYKKHNSHVQDMTWVAILKKYNNQEDCLIPRPETYDPSEFEGCCQEASTSEYSSDISAEKMLSYGKLPNDKYMLNWPIQGNDYYASVFDLTIDERKNVWQRAKERTLNMVYFIQNELGYKNIGLADEFPSKDNLALIPYNRESRRFKAYTRLKTDHLLHPYDYELYQKGVAVGDYPLDHHHDKNPKDIEENFPAIPSFSVPYDCLVSSGLDNLLLAEKNISVSHNVNGTTRLQPVVMQLGQTAGIAAGLSIKNSVPPKNLNIRYLQTILLKKGGYLLPFVDIDKDDSAFSAIQKTAAAGFFRGEGVPHKWANKTYFYPDQKATINDFRLIQAVLLEEHLDAGESPAESPIDPADIIEFINNQLDLDLSLETIGGNQATITRKELAVLLNKKLKLFDKPLYLNKEG